MNKTIEIFRIENQETMHGMWYREDGTFEPFIEHLTEGKSAKLPMEFNERYRTADKRWFSGAESMDDMRHWFSDRDALELFKNGYKLYRFETDPTQILRVEHETMFTREGILLQNEISLDTIWNIKNLTL
jgi:hypothetical protein